MSKEYVNRVAMSIVRQLQEGRAPWTRPWQSGERYLPHNPVSGHQYRGINVVWLMAQSEERGFQDTRWMTYRQALSAGAQVKRGEKGTVIQYWKWGGEKAAVDAQGKPMVDKHGNPQSEHVEYARPRVFLANVFNAEQVDGLPSLSVHRPPPEWQRHERADVLLKASGVPIRHQSQDRAFYDVRADMIVLPLREQFPTADGYYAVALHEAGHSTGHPSRLDRDLAHPFGSEKYAREELRAEIASLIMGDELGIGHDPGQHVAYIGSWIKILENDPLEIFRAASAAEKIQSYLFDLAQKQTERQERVSPPAEVRRGERMDIHIVRDALNGELEGYGLRVNVSSSEEFPGFELYRSEDLSPVLVTSNVDIRKHVPKRFDWQTTATEIVSWWERQRSAAAALRAPVEQVLTDNRWSFTHFRAYEGPSLSDALRAQGLATVGDVVGSVEATYWRHAINKLSPVFGMPGADADDPFNAYLERKGLATSFVTVAEQLVSENSQNADRYVLTDWEDGQQYKVQEYASLLDAVRALKRGYPLQVPALYLKRSGDVSFDERLIGRADSDGLQNLKKREDPAVSPLISTEWYDDGNSLRRVSPIAELTRLVDARDEDNLDQLRTSAVEAIQTFASAHYRNAAALSPSSPPSDSAEAGPNIAAERVDLHVPYVEKDAAFRAGAVWDRPTRTWYAPPGADLTALNRWHVGPKERSTGSATDPREEFAAALQQAGLVVDGTPEMDGMLHRVRVEGDRGAQRSGAYVGYVDGHPAGYIQNFKTGLKRNWKSANKAASLTEADRQRLHQEAVERQEIRARDRRQQQETVADRARWQLANTAIAPNDHPYLRSKGLTENVHALRQDRYGNLLVPAQDIDGVVWSIQRISETGEKSFLKGGRVDGCHALLTAREEQLCNSNPDGLSLDQTVLIVAEGYATGRTLQHATGLAVAVAFSSSNLSHVAQLYRDRFPEMYIVIGGDNDHRKALEMGPDGKPKKNAGKEAADLAANSIKGYALLPPFQPEDQGTDFNDFERIHGREATRVTLRDGIATAMVEIDAQRIAAGLRHFPVNHRGVDAVMPEMGYVVATNLTEAREKLRQGGWIRTGDNAAVSVAMLDVSDPDSAAFDGSRTDTLQAIESDRLRLANAKRTGHDGESVAETLRADEAMAQRADNPVQERAALDMMRADAEIVAEHQLTQHETREVRHRRAR